jgi:basic membrane protein A
MLHAALSSRRDGDKSCRTSMRKLLLLFGVLCALNLGLLFVRPEGAPDPASATVRVGLVFDVGGRGDKSFNDGAYEGAMRAARELGAGVRLIEPGEGSDREAGLRFFAAGGLDLVIGVGIVFTDDLLQLAAEFPGVRFAGVDFALKLDERGEPVSPPANLAALSFREEEGSYLVGAIAALVSKSHILGFVGGMDNPLIHKFEAGYRAGAQAVCGECRVIAKYAGFTPEAFRNPGKGKELALNQYHSGADIIFHASGSTGLGVFEAARATKKLAIGVDKDQYREAPGHILTSMVKGVDIAVFEVIRHVRDGAFRGGIYSFGLREKGLGYVYDENNRALIPETAKARADALAAEIMAGRIRVPEK